CYRTRCRLTFRNLIQCNILLHPGNLKYFRKADDIRLVCIYLLHPGKHVFDSLFDASLGPQPSKTYACCPDFSWKSIAPWCHVIDPPENFTVCIAPERSATVLPLHRRFPGQTPSECPLRSTQDPCFQW